MAWLTPDDGVGYCLVTIPLPNSTEVLAVLTGALSQTLKTYNWEQFGDLTPQQSVDIFHDAILLMSTVCAIPLIDDTGAILIDDTGAWMIDDNP